jgi:hypothetical protein
MTATTHATSNTTLALLEAGWANTKSTTLIYVSRIQHHALCSITAMVIRKCLPPQHHKA